MILIKMVILRNISICTNGWRCRDNVVVSFVDVVVSGVTVGITSGIEMTRQRRRTPLLQKSNKK